jgi:hypothetical protein
MGQFAEILSGSLQGWISLATLHSAQDFTAKLMREQASLNGLRGS